MNKLPKLVRDIINYYLWRLQYNKVIQEYHRTIKVVYVCEKRQKYDIISSICSGQQLRWMPSNRVIRNTEDGYGCWCSGHPHYIDGHIAGAPIDYVYVYNFTTGYKDYTIPQQKWWNKYNPTKITIPLVREDGTVRKINLSLSHKYKTKSSKHRVKSSKHRTKRRIIESSKHRTRKSPKH